VIAKSLLFSVGCVIYQTVSSKKYSNKQRILNSVYNKVYIELPKKVHELIVLGTPTSNQVREVKKYLCREIKKEFVFVSFIDEKKYKKIKKSLSDLEDAIAFMRSKKGTCSERIESLKCKMATLYENLDEFFDFKL
jgi:hypothetical protein